MEQTEGKKKIMLNETTLKRHLATFETEKIAATKVINTKKLNLYIFVDRVIVLKEFSANIVS
ncbi:hypothetical protein [Nostoc sp. UHCC 0251]|uniref:hypothetical protein n=1 Tax=Nostoc sp. UHCC 0251 TaxID=3110240 RepID=UPI002B1FB834|nr:hypothetical protein [Nostoc sp. UHCC 0251]MEA5626950.1 hypothetical protein [Nostoc sp. UHCC 0251]